MMSKKTILLTLALGVFAFTSVAFANYGEDNKLTGSVKEKGTLKAINKASVKLYKKNGKLKDSDKTSKKGKYEFKDLEEGTYTVKAKAAGFRNPSDAKKDTVSKKVKVDGSDTQNLQLSKV